MSYQPLAGRLCRTTRVTFTPEGTRTHSMYFLPSKFPHSDDNIRRRERSSETKSTQNLPPPISVFSPLSPLSDAQIARLIYCIYTTELENLIYTGLYAILLSVVYNKNILWPRAASSSQHSKRQQYPRVTSAV